MALSAFADKSHPPGVDELIAALGGSAALWEELISHAVASYAPITETWNFAGAKFGWSLRLKRKDRIVLYLIPQVGQFLLGVVLGDGAANAARSAGLPESVVALVDAAPRYAEGRGIRMPIATRDDLVAAQTLTALKMS
ncbi:MAG: DUF3788 family protein [Thermoanaerobaculales bacterium]